MNRSLLFLVSLISLHACSSKPSQESFATKLSPTDEPKLFYPGEVSIRNTVHYNSSFDNAGRTIVYTKKDNNNRSVASYQTFENGRFSSVKPIADDDKFAYGDPHISADGQTVIVSTNRPDNLLSSEGQIHQLWKYSRKQQGWGKPTKLSFEMDYLGGFGYPSLTANNTLYFQYFSASDRNMDIFYSKFEDGKYLKPVKLPKQISGKQFEGDPFIDKQERYLIFAGFNREPNYGLSDLYITFKQGNTWSEPQNLGKRINSHGYDGSPYVTPDDKYLLFTSSRHPDKPDGQEKFNVFYVSFDLEKYKSTAQF